MKQKKLISIIACAVLAITFLFGFSGDDDRLSTTTSSWQTSSSEVVITNGNQPDLVGAWTSGTNFPAPLTDLSHGQGFERNDTAWVFIIGGEANLTDVRRYNVNTDTWSTVAPLPSGRDRGASARLKDSLYMIGGANTSTTYSNTLYRYDINGNSWSSKANIPQNIGWGKAAGYQDSLIYLVGGYNGSATLSTVYVYNCISDTWRTCTSLPAVRFGGAMAIVGDTIVYAAGVDGAAIVNTTYRGVINQSDRSMITWTTGAPMPAPVSTGMFRIDGHTWGNRGMILTGGSTAVAFSSVSNVCLIYSPGADSWTQEANKPTPWTAGQSGVVKYSNGIWKLVCASGYGGSSQIAQTEIFTDTLSAPPGGNTTLVLTHDTTITGGAKRLADKDSLFAYLPQQVSGYDYMTFDTNTVLPSLTGYKTIIIQETSFDAITCRWLGQNAKDQLKAWLGSGTPADKKALLMMGADLGYNYSRTASNGDDTVFSHQMGGYVFRVDNGMNSSPYQTMGVGIDVGQTRNMTSTPAGNGYYPDGCSPNNGAVSLYKYRTQTAADTLGAVARNTSGYVFASLFQDPRYFTDGDFKPVLEALIGYLVSNGATITGHQNISTIVPDKFVLSQNYPNPFNPSTKINFSIPKAGFVTLKVYDMLGREVKTLVSDQLTAGEYVSEFDGALLSSGTYFYRIQAGDFVETKRMVLVK